MAFQHQVSFLLLLLPFLLLTPAAAHNITRLLSQFPDFSTFNSLLSKSGIADEINRRQTITVLALDNSAASALSSLPDDDTLKQVLAVHVILDYYDNVKIHSLRRKSTLFTTLFQTTGVAENQMGFLNFTRLADGRLAFGSATHGSSLVATFVKSVSAKPYNISVLQISSAIVPPGINGAPLAPFGAPINVPPEPLVPAPAPVDDKVSDGPAEAPEAADAPAPTPDSPAGSPGPAPEAVSDGPTTGEVADEASSAGRVAGGINLGLVMAGVVFLGF
ncbi:fasciclin-like arabinogalactan protein 14 [Canna indica]|uniref:Fasciclin-like arabinogalactan protein 14 n=1 Tax=Canna indica TaxID=4628 RepID=A0AAQ3L5P7_9LILI|nr:fasciclin-like arabinogalactan protein 14 [Canna indica]